MLMALSIFLEGKEYISASRASKKIGYASDYIGQLCRAKKIPGRLIGRTWYVDFALLTEHKKNRQLGKVKKLVVKKLVESASIEKPILTLTPNAEFPKKLFFTYENDNRPWLPKLSKKGRYIEPIWTSALVGRAAAFSMALLLVISVTFFTLEKTNPRVAIETRSKLEHIYNIPKEFLIESAQIYANATLKFADEVSTQLAAVSVSDSLGSSTMLTINNLFEAMRMSLRHLKQIALSKFFFPFVPSQLTYTVPATSPPPSRALTTPASSINLGSLKSELKTELENYIRLQIDSILPRQGGTNSPIVVYTSAPALATADFESFRTNSVVPEIHYHVTNQSNSDAERNSINLSNITDGGTFTNASISNSTFSGSLVSASSLSFGNATGTSATTTNFFSTTASSTNLFATTGNIGTLTVGSCTGCGNSGADFPFTVTGYGVSTSTTLGFLQGFLSTASSTIDSNLRITGNLLVNGNSTTTNATTTNLFSTTASSTNLYSTNLFGNTANLTESGNLFYTDTRVNSYIHASTTIPKTYTANTFTGAQILDNITRSTSTNATTTNLFSTTASSTNLFTQLFTLNGFTLSSTANGTIGGTNTGDVTLAGTPDYLTISGQTITRNKLDISDDTNATGGLGLTLTANDFACDTANSTTFGCLASADWTTFNNKLSSYDAFTHPAYGGSATTSLLTLSGGFLNTAASSTIVGNLLITGNSTTTNATTTNFFSTTASSTNLYTTNLFGNTANLTESGNLFYTDTRVNSYIHASTTIPKTYTANTFTGAQILDNITRSTSTNATTTNLFSTTASSTNLFTQLFTLNGFTLSSTANGTIGGTNTGDVTLAGTPDYLTISGQTITRNKLDISDDTNATGGLGLTLTANDFACDTANSTTFGCLASADWTTFNNKLGAYDAWTHPAYGGSATTSLLTLSGGFLNTAASSTIVGNLLITGNSTTTNATTTNFFTTTASTTNFFGAGLTTCQSNNVLTYDGAGKFGCEADDSGSGSGSDPFTHPSFGFSATTSQMLFGTSTASNYQLTVSSSTAPQLSLSSGAGFGQWTFRNAGGNLYFATTTVAGTATTSTSALTIIGSSGNVGIASSTPWGLFSINPDRLGSGVPAFVVGSSTATLFSITSGGSPGGVFNYGTNATSTIPNNKLYAWTIATSTTATPIFRIDTTSSGAGSVSATTSIRGGFVLDDGAFNYDSFAGVTSVDSLSTGPMAFDDNAGILSWMDMPVSTTTAGIVMSYSAQIGGTSILTVYSESKGTGGGIKNGRIGIGTTSPYALLSLATTTNQLIDLFAISTSTSGIVFKVDSYGRTYGDGAYASPAADYAEYFYTKSAALKSGEVVCVDILENNAVKRCERGADNNVMGIVSTKPAVIGNYIKAAEADPSHYAIIGMLGQVDAFVSAENGPINVGDSLTSASSTPGYAMRALGGDSTVAVALEPFNGTGTSTSLSTSKIKVLISRRNKSLEVEEVESLVIERVANMKIEDKVGQMIKQSVDNLNLDPKITAIARDEVEQAIAKLNESFDSLKIQTLASTTLSLGVRLDDIESVFAPATSTATSTTNSFADNFFKNLFNRLTAWLASAANGIGDFFANRVRTKELCVSDDSGAETCLSKAQLDQLLGNVVSSDAEESVVPAPSELIELIESENSSESERPEDSSEPERPVIEEPVVPDDSVGLPAGEAGTPTDNVEAEPAPEPTPESVSTP